MNGFRQFLEGYKVSTRRYTGNKMPSANAVIETAKHVGLSERDSLRVMRILENPPKPNAKLRAVAHELAKKKA
jgi:uncharacterized protein (DUF1778 family)